MALIAWAAFLNLDGDYQPWLVLVLTMAIVGSLFQACRLFIIRTLRRRAGRTTRAGWASLACAMIGLALLLSPYRPLTDREQRLCGRAVTVAIVAERHPRDANAASVLGILARERHVRYAIRNRIEQAANAVAASQEEGLDERTPGIAEASKHLQLSCGYRRPPF